MPIAVAARRRRHDRQPDVRPGPGRRHRPAGRGRPAVTEATTLGAGLPRRPGHRACGARSTRSASAWRPRGASSRRARLDRDRWAEAVAAPADGYPTCRLSTSRVALLAPGQGRLGDVRSERNQPAWNSKASGRSAGGTARCRRESAQPGAGGCSASASAAPPSPSSRRQRSGCGRVAPGHRQRPGHRATEATDVGGAPADTVTRSSPGTAGSTTDDRAAAADRPSADVRCRPGVRPAGGDRRVPAVPEVARPGRSPTTSAPCVEVISQSHLSYAQALSGFLGREASNDARRGAGARARRRRSPATSARCSRRRTTSSRRSWPRTRADRSASSSAPTRSTCWPRSSPSRAQRHGAGRPDGVHRPLRAAGRQRGRRADAGEGVTRVTIHDDRSIEPPRCAAPRWSHAWRMAAVIAACGNTEAGRLGRVGLAPTTTKLPDARRSRDVALLRTCSSLQYSLLEVYTRSSTTRSCSTRRTCRSSSG